MSNADVVIAALRTGYDELAELVRSFSDADLAKPSGASEWDIAQVLSHLGSGAEILTATVRAALDGTPEPAGDFNQTVWDRWNAASRREQADGFLDKNEALTALFESLDDSQRDEVRVKLAWLPEPADVATIGQIRLNELTLHSWDVRVGVDEKATLAADAVPLLLERIEGTLGWISKPAELNGEYSVIQVNLTDPPQQFTLRLNDPVSIDSEPVSEPDGTLTLPAEAWLRLATGRLATAPVTLETTGAASLETLRRVFQGY
ncbi:maleylpyruvate isomerase family mycothiol-dependent enzyme [Kribbella sp. NPDC006257]|uniref:maleylpyruvate isomerase family mycothiol-dependent enzyme n=1 Tax=Kribbella sp. NPDC006257 TaxID=3156738 RepID=UPI0033B0B922